MSQGTSIQLNEQHLGPFAGRAQALEVIEELRAAGWPVTYTPDPHAGRWQFATRRQASDFERAFEACMDNRGASIEISWGCECGAPTCDPEDRCTCDPGQDVGAQTSPAFADDSLQALRELYGYELEAIVEQFYPGLREWITLNVNSLYGAIAYGIRYGRLTGTGSATQLFLGRTWKAGRGKLRTYDRGLEEFARFVMFAADDAYMSEVLARARVSLEELEWCPTCHDIVGVNCECEGAESGGEQP